MRILVLLLALAMPIVAWFSEQGLFGPTNAEISARYPTLLVAAGYAFSVWGLIFALDIAFALWQLRTRLPLPARLRLAAAAGFALTAAWMPVFAQQWFGLALLVIFGALAALLYATVGMARLAQEARGAPRLFGWLPLSLHGGWLSLAAFLNLAQVIVAWRLLPTDNMLGWSLALFAAAAALLLLANRTMRGNLAYVAVALWGLVAVYVKQSGWNLPGSDATAWVALGIGALLVAQTLMLRNARR